MFVFQVVERLLSLPAEYWSQFLVVEQDHHQGHADHMIIENTNVYSTPDQKGMMVFCSTFNVMWCYSQERSVGLVCEIRGIPLSLSFI